MDQFTFDCRQLDQWDSVSQPPVPVRDGSRMRPGSPKELAALKSAARFGKLFNPLMGNLEEVVGIASKPPKVTLVAPTKMAVGGGRPRILFKSSPSMDMTASLAIAGSIASGIGPGGLVSMGVFASTTREWGTFVTLGGGLFFNTPTASIGGEFTSIAGTPSDFSGPYLGVSGGFGTVVGATFTVLFSPTLPLTVPLTLTFMGVAISLSAVTPADLPVTISIEVTNTRITSIRKF
jgi:hypothetical protein